MYHNSLEQDVLERFGDDNLMWVVLWGNVIQLQNYIADNANIPLERLNAGIDAADYLSQRDGTTHFKAIKATLQEFRNILYPQSWSSRFAQLLKNGWNMLLAPFKAIGNELSEAVIEISTETSIDELKKIGRDAVTNDDLKIPVFSSEIEIAAPLVVSLKNYFQQKINAIDDIIQIVQTFEEKEYELEARDSLIKQWDAIVKPLQESNAIEFCENVKQYMQQQINQEDSIMYPIENTRKGLLFNAPQHKMDYNDLLLEQAKSISYKLKK